MTVMNGGDKLSEIGSAAFLLDRQARVLEMDREAEQLTGWGAMSLIGQKIDGMVFHSPQSGGFAVQELIALCLREERDIKFDNLIVECLDGSLLQVNGSLQRLYLEEDANVFALMMAVTVEQPFDMTREKYDAGCRATESAQSFHSMETGAHVLQ